MQAWVVAEAMTPNVHAAGRWFKLANEMHRNIGFSPIEICQWASQTGGAKEAVANYLVRAGYLRLAPRTTT
jgi:phage portal protein BeeE